MSNCTECIYCIEEDIGYSNYTVEGTEADCLLNLNPGLPKDRWYREEPWLFYSNECERFTKGGSVKVDVDRNWGALENYSDDFEIKDLLRLRNDRAYS